MVRLICLPLIYVYLGTTSWDSVTRRFTNTYSELMTCGSHSTNLSLVMSLLSKKNVYNKKFMIVCF